MPIPRYRARTFRRIFVKTPGGRTTLHYELRKPSKARCANCGKPLHGVERQRPCKMKALAKTKKRPQRSFGGYYCAACAREKIKDAARAIKLGEGKNE